jgi:hypothetical protein
MWLAVPDCAHLSIGWAQKLAQSRWCPGPRFACGIVRLRILMRGVFRPAEARPSTLFSAPFSLGYTANLLDLDQRWELFYNMSGVVYIPRRLVNTL